jgi:hypothetical protein
MFLGMNKSIALNAREFGKRVLAVFAIVFLSMSASAFSWYGGAWNGGCGYGYNGSGYWGNGAWCGTGIPNGLGWTLFGIEAASAIALPVAIVSSELSEIPYYNFDGNLNYDYSSYGEPYVAYGDESPYVLSTPWPLVIGVGYPIYPLSGWGYGWGGSSGYCYNGWHGYRGYGYGSGYGYYPTALGAADASTYSKGNSYYRGTTNAGHENFHAPTTIAEAEQNYHTRSGNLAAQAGATGFRPTLAMSSKSNAYHGGTAGGVRPLSGIASTAPSRFHSPNTLAEAEQTYHARTGSLASQAGVPGYRQTPDMSSKGNNYNAGIPGGVRTHGGTDYAASGSSHSPSTLAEAQQTYHPPLISSQSESISKSHWNTSRIASPNSTDSTTIASSARSEHVAEVHPGFHGIDPTTYMQSAGSYRRSANEFSSSPGGGLSAPQRGPSAKSFSESTPHGVRSPSAIRQERASSSGLSSRQQVASAGREAPPASNHVSSRGASISINREAGSAKASAGVVAPTSSQRVATSGVAQRPTQTQHSSTGSRTIGSHSLEHGGSLTGAAR